MTLHPDGMATAALLLAQLAALAVLVAVRAGDGPPTLLEQGRPGARPPRAVVPA